jgi:hypothetical protein
MAQEFKQDILAPKGPTGLASTQPIPVFALPPPSINYINPYPTREEYKRRIFANHNVPLYAEEDILILDNYEIVIVCDDSISMQKQTSAFDTRWSELQKIITIIVDICRAIYKKGITIHFLNRPSLYEVVTKDKLKTSFMIPPFGSPSLTPILQDIFETSSIKPKIIIIATDGLLLNNQGDDATQEFIKLLNERNIEQNRICILACTDDVNIMNYLNELVAPIEGLELVNNFINSRVNVSFAQQNLIEYSMTEHILRILLASVIEEYAEMAMIPLQFNAQGFIIKRQLSGTPMDKSKLPNNGYIKVEQVSKPNNNCCNMM